MKRRRLVADVGGTRSRFAVSDRPGAIDKVQIYRTADRPSFAATLSAYTDEIGAGDPQSWCRDVKVAAAGPVDGGVVHLTNSEWRIDAAELAHRFGVPVGVVNDLEAVGLLLPHLTAGDIAPVGATVSGGLIGNRIAINVGTGFGAATAVRPAPGLDGGQWAIAAGEAGHMSLAASSPEEAAAFTFAGSVEDVLSGAGVVRLYEALAGVESGSIAGTAIFARAHADPIAGLAVRMLSRLLGRVAGDLVLATAAWDGAYLCGSVAQAWSNVGDTAAFREAFESKGAMSDRMAHVPVQLIAASEPALLGLTYA